MRQGLEDLAKENRPKHPKCKGYDVWSSHGYGHGCGYETTLTCDDCKYCAGRKDPKLSVIKHNKQPHSVAVFCVDKNEIKEGYLL